MKLPDVVVKRVKCLKKYVKKIGFYVPRASKKYGNLKSQEDIKEKNIIRKSMWR